VKLQQETSVDEQLLPEVLLMEIATAAHDKKGLNILALDLRELVYYTDYFLICTGGSERHVRAVSREIEKRLADFEIEPVGIEGRDHNRWVLMDYGSVIVHLFIGPLRDLYELERLWVDAPQVPLGLPEQPVEPDDEDAFSWEVD